MSDSEQSSESRAPRGARLTAGDREAAYSEVERRVRQLTDQLAESERAAQARAAEMIEKENALNRQLAEQRRENEALTTALAEKDQTARSLSQRLESMNEQMQGQAAQLRDTSAELQRIKGTLGWRLLSLYGPIKYRYLLPLYRRLGFGAADDTTGLSTARAIAGGNTGAQPVETSTDGLEENESEPSANGGARGGAGLPSELTAGPAGAASAAAEETAGRAAKSASFSHKGESGRPADELPAEVLTGAAAEVAERFAQFKTPHNRRYFAALCKHFQSITHDPCLPLYFEFAITCNKRGRVVAELLSQRVDLRGKQYLDIGCAYGGFLVAFAECGAEPIGVEINLMLLELAKSNLRDHGLDVPLLLKDATRADQLAGLMNQFDVVTCNDVIEHVDDPQALLHNTAMLLGDNGVAYFEIPNRYAPLHVLRDGHYQLFGITLLDYEEARAYFADHAPGTDYSVRHYLELEQYAAMFARAGMEMEVLYEPISAPDLDTVLADLRALREGAAEGLAGVPPRLRPQVEEGLRDYLLAIDAWPRATEDEKRTFLLRYGAGFWRVVGRKTAAPAGPGQ
ncbi:MAG TPA: methyltransferase domain-containing protein [Blastocatellia bacterium]|nr:methyltransferase domain-containing protein [Blastocatellia bacterium]